MTIVTSQAAYEKALAASAPGDTIVVEGVLPTLSLKASTASVPGRKPNLTVVLEKAEIIAPVRTGGFDGLHLIGGTYRGGITLNDGKNFSLTGDAKILGTEARSFNGVSLQRVAGARVEGVVVRDCLNGVVIAECQDFDVGSVDLERIRKDVINVFASQRGRLRKNGSRDHRPLNIGLPNADHPDAVQMFGAAGKPAVTDILIEDNDFDIEHGQGITQTWKEGNGDPRFARITYRRNRVKCGSPVGFGMLGVDDGLLEDNSLEGYDTAAHVVRFFVDPRCTGIVWKGKNLQAAHKGHPEVSWPPTVAEPAADPRLAQLEAALASAHSDITALNYQLADRDAVIAALEAWKLGVEAAVAAK